MKMMILDGSGYMYRAYHGLPPLHDHQGQAVHAVFGFFKMLFKIFYEKPDYFVIAWDAPHKTVRHEAFKEYKATRPPTPDDLKHQIVMIKKIIAQLQIPFLEVPGYEADDIIFTLTQQFKGVDNMHISIVSSDKDLKQILDTNVVFFDPLKGEKIDTVNFITTYGFPPKNIIDFLALVGDSSDNVPGVPGIGKKTAQDLIAQYGTLESIYDHLDEMSAKLRQKLIDGKELGQKSKQLISLLIVPGLQQIQLNDTVLKINYELLREILVNQHNFQSFEKNVEELRKIMTKPQQQSLFG